MVASRLYLSARVFGAGRRRAVFVFAEGTINQGWPRPAVNHCACASGVPRTRARLVARRPGKVFGTNGINHCRKPDRPAPSASRPAPSCTPRDPAASLIPARPPHRPSHTRPYIPVGSPPRVLPPNVLRAYRSGLCSAEKRVRGREMDTRRYYTTWLPRRSRAKRA